MRMSIHWLWGCAHGPIKCAAPQTRLITGVALFTTCLISAGSTLGGSLCTTAATTLWLLLCRPPWRVVRVCLGLGLALFLPYFLFLPLLLNVPSTMKGFQHALVVLWNILLKGICGMLISVATVSSLTATDLRDALLRLPVPGIISAILIQVIHQSATLFHETQKIAAAIAVRGASSGGRVAWRVLFSLPRVWMPRIIVRADRVGAAMELRGYGDRHFESPRPTRFGHADLSALSLAASLLSIAIVLRILGGP